MEITQIHQVNTPNPIPNSEKPQQSKIIPVKSNNILILILSILFLILLGISVYFGYNYYVLKFQSTKSIPLIKTLPQVESPNTINPTSKWKEYKNSKYSFKYPNDWILEEKCQKIDTSTNNLCVYSPDYQLITQKISPGEGGIDNITLYNIGNLLSVNILNNIEFNLKNYCAPGGPMFMENCHEKSINGHKFAVRELGWPPNTTSIDAWLIINSKAALEITFDFSKENKQKDLQLFDQILCTVKLINAGSLKPVYTCPPGGWINCMPILTDEAKKTCTDEAISWYRANCSNFQGLAQ